MSYIVGMGANELREILARIGMTQLRLATVLGVAPSTVRRWVHKSKPMPIPKTVEIILRLAAEGRINLNELEQ